MPDLVAPLKRCRFDYRFHIAHALGILGGPQAERVLGVPGPPTRKAFEPAVPATFATRAVAMWGLSNELRPRGSRAACDYWAISRTYPMSFLWSSLLIIVLLVGWGLTVIGMPGNWMMVIAAAVYAFLTPEESPAVIGWGVVGALAVLAALGELLEFLAAALGVAKARGSRRGAVLALVGSLMGGIAGIFVGVPIPVIGPIVAAVLFAGVGALCGAMVGEGWKGRSLGDSWQVGKGAFWGRLLGTFAKILVGSVIVVIAVLALAL